MTRHGTPASAYTASELLAVMAARLLKDGQIVFAGVGIPLLAATLAQRNFAPHLTILFEGGTIGPFIVPGELPPSTNEQRCTRRANMVLPITDVLLLLQRGYVDVGFMGGAQIDRFGNPNSSFIADAGEHDLAVLEQARGHHAQQLGDRVGGVFRLMLSHCEHSCRGGTRRARHPCRARTGSPARIWGRRCSGRGSPWSP